MEKITAKKIRAALIANLRFVKQVSIIATEAGLYNADILAIKDQKLIEYEIKISKSDLLKDFKKFKHQIYLKNQSEYTPRQFYYVVPNDLINTALELTKNTKYGVIEYRYCRLPDGRYTTHDGVIIKKRAKNIHSRTLKQNVVDSALSRMSSQLANFLLKEAVNTK